MERENPNRQNNKEKETIEQLKERLKLLHEKYNITPEMLEEAEKDFNPIRELQAISKNNKR